MRKYVVEAIGTFFLMMTIGQVVIEPGSGAWAPLAIGAVLTVMVYAGGHISGAHYNPAVTLAVLIRGRTSFTELLGYWASQLLGAALAVLVVGYLKDGPEVIVATPDVGRAFVAELIFTFALVWVILNVATARGTEGNSYFGLAIGFTVLAGAYAVGGISGGAFNPAVAMGITLLGLSGLADLWIFLVANFLGGAAAAVAFNVLDLGDDKPTTATPADQRNLQPAGVPEA